MRCPVRHRAKRAGPGGHSSNRRAKLGGTAPEPSPPQAAEVAEDGEGGGRGPRGPRSPGGARSAPGRSNAASALAQLRRGTRRRKRSPEEPQRTQPPQSAPAANAARAPEAKRPTANPNTPTRARRGAGFLARAERTQTGGAERRARREAGGRGGAAAEARRSAQARAAPADGPQPGTPMVRGDGWLDGCRRAAARLTPANQRAAARNPREGNSDTRAGANKRNWPRAQRRKCAVRPQGGCRWEPPFPPLNVPLGAERQRGRGGEGGREAQAGGEGAGARKRRQQGGTNRKTRTLSRRSRQQPRFFLLDFPRFSLLTAL